MSLQLVEQVFGRVTLELTEEDAMGVTDSLREAGYVPEVNQDQAFETLIGQYQCYCSVLRPETGKDGRPDTWAAQWLIEKVLEGTHVDTDVAPDKRRRFFKRYQKDADGLKKMLNDFFTMGVTLDQASDVALEASFTEAIGKTAFLRAWGWTPDKTVSGASIPEHERKAFQQFVIKREADVKLKGAVASSAKVPF